MSSWKPRLRPAEKGSDAPAPAFESKQASALSEQSAGSKHAARADTTTTKHGETRIWRPKCSEALAPTSECNGTSDSTASAVLVGTSGLMGLKMREYSKTFSVVEINHTFHQAQPRCEEIKSLADQLRTANLQAVVKVSRFATHDMKLSAPEQWWQALWNCYSELQSAGVLLGMLWQLPPSFTATPNTIDVLEHLLTHVRSLRGAQTRHVFDFRHNSWYTSKQVLQTMRRHNACLAWLHLRNDASRWAGDLPSGWSTSAKTADFVYLRLFGSKGRSIGQYSEQFLLQEVLPWLPKEQAFVIFGQGDVPAQALENAESVLRLLREPSAKLAAESPEPASVEESQPQLVSGRVVRVTDGQLFVDIGDGQEAIIGTRHLRHTTLSANMSRGKRQGRRRFQIGEDLSGLQIEHVDPETKRVFLSAAKAYEEHAGQEEEEEEEEEGGEEEATGKAVENLPSSTELGVDATRKLQIITWGNSKMQSAPKAQLHVTCNYKKFHYLTRNNKHIKWLNGMDAEVKDRVRKSAFLESWLRDTIPRIEHENAPSVALHCYKGTHLSVAIAELLRELYYPNATVQHLSLKAERAGHKGGPARH